MNKEELIVQLNKQYQYFVDFLNDLTREEFQASHNQKWLPGEELSHIVKSMLPLSTILSQKSIIISKFGCVDRKGFGYEEIVTRYHVELRQGGKATSPFIPNKVEWQQKEVLMNALFDALEIMDKCLGNYSEDELDTLALPHPLLGELSIREMMYFTIYHAKHHLKNIKSNLKK